MALAEARELEHPIRVAAFVEATGDVDQLALVGLLDADARLGE